MTGYLSHKLMQYYLASQIKDDASLYLVKEAYTWSICNFLKESIKFTSTTYCLRSSCDQFQLAVPNIYSSRSRLRLKFNYLIIGRRTGRPPFSPRSCPLRKSWLDRSHPERGYQLQYVGGKTKEFAIGVHIIKMRKRSKAHATSGGCCFA